MPEAEDRRAEMSFQVAVPQKRYGFSLKGSSHLDWGLKNRLAGIFDAKTGRTVMLAIDHGSFQGPTTGLERVDLSIEPLLRWADSVVCTRGILRSVLPPTFRGGVVLRAGGGPSVLTDLSDEEIALSMEEAVRLNAAAVSVQVFIGGAHETKTVHNMTRLVDQAHRHGIATLAVTAVEPERAPDARHIRLATRICAELGATCVATRYVPDGFDTVTAACPVPILVAGGAKLPERDALKLVANAVLEGAAGVDMGRNIFQCEDPAAMLRAVRKVVHKSATPQEAHEFLQDAKEKRPGKR